MVLTKHGAKKSPHLQNYVRISIKKSILNRFSRNNSVHLPTKIKKQFYIVQYILSKEHLKGLVARKFDQLNTTKQSFLTNNVNKPKMPEQY
jgi:hypothetical protein